MELFGTFWPGRIRPSFDKGWGSDFVIATKFLTKRALNVDAIEKASTPFWRSWNGYKVKKEGDHVMLFTFVIKIEIKKNPIDRTMEFWQTPHGFTKLSRIRIQLIWILIWLHFGCKFMKYQSISELETWRKKIRGAIGKVTRPAEDCEVEGYDFIRVRVTIDISQSLCRGRIISLENGKEL